MPNHCEGELTVTGPSDEVKRFRELHGEALLDANKVIPYPERFREQDRKAEAHNKAKKPEDHHMKDGFNSGGCEWCINNWGTKWGFYDVVLLDEGHYGDEARVRLGFSTAWSPAEPLFAKMVADFPKLNFVYEYWEGGMGFQGHMVGVNGVVTCSELFDYCGCRGG